MRKIRIETVNADSFSMDYFRFGHGEKTFVILPGLSVQSVTLFADSVAAQYRAANDEYTVYLFDRRKNLPESYSVYDMAKDTAAAFRILGLEHIYLFGASQGGMIAMEITIRYPELVEKLVVGSSSARVLGKGFQAVQNWAEIAKTGNTRELYQAFGKAIYPPKVYEQLSEYLADSSKSVTQEELDRFIILAQGSGGFDVLDELENISCPMLLIGSKDDQVLGVDATEKMIDKMRGIPRFQYYMYDGYGHAAYDLAPDYLQRILRFFAQDELNP